MARTEAMSSTLRALEVLDLLAQPPYELTLSTIGLELGLAPATAHRLTATLCAAGYAEQDSESRRYRLAGKALWAGTGYLRRSPVYQAAFLVLQETAAQACGLVHLGTIDGEWLLYLHTVGSPSSLYLYADTGERRHLHSTGLGKALLAFQPSEVVAKIVGRKLPRFTPHTITDKAGLTAELGRIRSNGYAIDNEEGALGLRCVAAPIRDRQGIAVAAFSMSAPAAVLTEQTQEEYIAVIRDAALKVSAQLGFRPAHSNRQFSAGGA
jgi:DNA-binding IclR family transcriptional regulator